MGWDPAAGPGSLVRSAGCAHDVARRQRRAQNRWRLIPPKVLEPCRRQFRISNRVADIAMPEVILNRSRIVAITSKLVSRTMSPVTIRPLMSILAQRVAHINRPIRHYSPANVGSCSTGLATSELRRMFLQLTAVKVWSSTRFARGLGEYIGILQQAERLRCE